MDLPIFHLDLINNRILIAVIAVVHVVINHTMAVGGIPLVVFLENKGQKCGEVFWDDFAFRLLRLFFIVTTTVGALTGVGIWLSASLVNPYAIGSLIRVFFWTWFVEWIVFVTEICLILRYYLTWKTWIASRKQAHVKLGRILALASWITMALIVSILGFMMDPGSWRSDRTLLSGMLNPIYLPQLAFRTPLAMMMAGTFAFSCLPWLTQPKTEERFKLSKAISAWTLAWLPFCAFGGIAYARAVPKQMLGNLDVALTTQALEGWANQAQIVLIGACSICVMVMIWAWLQPFRLPRILNVVPICIAICVLGTFERVREFIRKPYAISGYLYANGFRAEDYPMLQRDGILMHATYTRIRVISADNESAAGREVFKLACTRCHTVDGVNGIRANLARLYGMGSPSSPSWHKQSIAAYIGSMHNTRLFMPPFPGNEKEKLALASWLVSLEFKDDPLEGDQNAGVSWLPTPQSADLSSGGLK